MSNLISEIDKLSLVKEWKLQHPGFSGKLVIEINCQEGETKKVYFNTEMKVS